MNTPCGAVRCRGRDPSAGRADPDCRHRVPPSAHGDGGGPARRVAGAVVADNSTGPTKRQVVEGLCSCGRVVARAVHVPHRGERRRKPAPSRAGRPRRVARHARHEGGGHRGTRGLGEGVVRPPAPRPGDGRLRRPSVHPPVRPSARGPGPGTCPRRKAVEAVPHRCDLAVRRPPPAPPATGVRSSVRGARRGGTPADPGSHGGPGWTVRCAPR